MPFIFGLNYVNFFSNGCHPSDKLPFLRFINGKKITTKKTFSNGQETVKTYENDVLVSHTVNGQPQRLTINEAGASNNHHSSHRATAAAAARGGSMSGSVGGSGGPANNYMGAPHSSPSRGNRSSQQHLRHQYRRL